jgi:maleylacetoacetate isomerase
MLQNERLAMTKRSIHVLYAPPMETILYHFGSSSPWRVRWALAVKRVPHRAVKIDLAAGEQWQPEHLARNPMGSVPALFIDGRCLAESVAILEYIEERFPEPPLYPRDPWARARVRQVVEVVNAGIQPLQNMVVRKYVSDDAAAQKSWAGHWNERGMGALEKLLGTIDRELGAGEFAVGNQLTAADLFLVPQVDSARRFGVDVSRFPRVLRAEAAALATEFAQQAKDAK